MAQHNQDQAVIIWLWILVDIVIYIQMIAVSKTIDKRVESNIFFIDVKVQKISGWEDDNLLEITPLIVNRIVNSRFQRINVQIYTIYL